MTFDVALNNRSLEYTVQCVYIKVNVFVIVSFIFVNDAYRIAL